MPVGGHEMFHRDFINFVKFAYMFFLEESFQFLAKLIFCNDGRPQISNVYVYGVFKRY